jgi:acyl carrier protein
MNIEKIVIDNLTHALGMAVGDITVDSTKRDLNINDLDTIEIFMGLEDEFSIEISDEDVAKLSSIQGIIDYIKLRLDAR